jgi:ferric-dicitrate binding protein FerR (iron transport regulator)
MFFEVDKRPGQDFQVDTPYLAAIVKGTSFSVSFVQEQSRVDVAEGSVGVSSNATGQAVVIGPGQFARVTADPASGVSVGTAATSRRTPTWRASKAGAMRRRSR